MKILTYKDQIIKLLKENYHLRDDDNKLIANVWYSQIKGTDLSAFDFLGLFAKGKLANPESIRRIRQKLQEEFPNLRGDAYNERHKETESVKDELFNTPELYLGGTP